MSSQVYRWKRFWCPRTASMSFADGGYLYDPESEWGHFYNPDLVTFEAIAELPCLVLLGEPGIGKTHAITAEQDRFINQIRQKGCQALSLDLRSFSNECRLVDKLFKSAVFTSWVTGTHRLYIFLDSLDECLLRINTVAALLIDELKEYRGQLDRLYLRITCRTAVLPTVLEEGLKELWGSNSVRVYELAPLRKVDVREAANANGIDPDAFLQEVYTKKAVPLAIKPITLKFLLNTYRQNGQFSPAQKSHELYLEGCRLLCEELNSSRCSSKQIGNLDVEKRLIVAARIAAITIFANRFAVWTEVDLGDVPSEDILLRTLCRESEIINGKQFQVSEADIRETLDTGLFSSRGANRIGWAHQTYAEFLAAWYIEKHQLTLPGIMRLIVHSDDPNGRIVPQLHQTVVWLCGMKPQVFREVMKTDPDVLLHTDVATADEADKAALVESLLKLHNEERLLYRPSSWLYANLNHPNLAAQLQSYICDATKSDNARNVAIDVVKACEVKVLQEHLADVALALDQPYWVRVNAADAVCGLGDEEIKARLQPLAIGKAGDDPADELKGYGLRAVRSNHLTALDLFSTLTQPKTRSIGGTYQDFIAKDIGQHLQLADLPVALEWFEKQPPRQTLTYPFAELSDAIFLKAWENIQTPEILDAFAKIVFFKLKEYDEIIDCHREPSFEQLLRDDDKKRRQLIEAIVGIIPDSEKNPFWLGGTRTVIILPQDFLWLIERLQTSQSEHEQQVWAKLIWQKFKRFDPEQVNAVLIACYESPILEAEFASFIKAIDLGSSTAEKAKSYYLEEQSWRDRNENQSLLEPPPRERVLKVLDEFEAGEIESWWNLCREMTLQENSTRYGNLLRSELTTLRGWIEAEEMTKVRIIEAAKVYIYQAKPPKTDDYSALAGFKALRLLLQKDPEFSCTISVEVWKKWVPIILTYSKSNDERDPEIHQELVSKAYQNAPTEVINTLIFLIDRENQQNGFVSINHVVKNCWDERLAGAILSKAQDKQLKPKSLGCLLEDLLTYNVAQAKTFAESLIPSPPPTENEERSRAIAAASALMSYSKDAGWEVIWSAIQQDPAFGRELIETISFSLKYTGSIEQKLKEECLADLYIFLVKQYPLSEKSKQDDVDTWKKYIVQRLTERGTPQSCEAIRRLICILPQMKDNLRWALSEAEALTRRQTWVAPQPEEILRIVSEKQSHTMSVSVVHVLHLSDLHFGTIENASNWYSQLAEDLIRDLNCPRLDALILSGDIANKSIVEEYTAAKKFLSNLCEEFSLQPEQIVIVPGNHDLNWDNSKKAYSPVRREAYKGPMIDEKGKTKTNSNYSIDKDEYVEVLDQEKYKYRFANFCDFYSPTRIH